MDGDGLTSNSSIRCNLQLNIARSLGGLWSYSAKYHSYCASRLPDVTEYMIDLN